LVDAAPAVTSDFVINDLELAIKLQRIDVRAAELRNEIAALPKHIAAIEKTLESHQRKLDADRALLASNQKERRQMDGEAQVQQQKISKLRDQMMAAKTNEQYRAFQHEIEFCEAAIRKGEDRVLELMLEMETLEKNVKAAEDSLKKEREQVEREKARARERTSADQTQLDELMAERKTIVAQMSPQLANNYERIRKKSPIAVADATDGRCSACQLELRPQLFQELRRGDRILQCENCRRMLYYNPPVEFDTDTGAPEASGTRVDMT
jgi:predicted  nucleic acid-binding Zn-ribbon protein